MCAELFEKDIEKLSPTELRAFDDARLAYIAQLEKDNAALRGLITALHARLVAHGERLAEMIPTEAVTQVRAVVSR